MRFGVVVFPGTWSECDFHYVISEVIRQPVKYVWHRDRNLSDLDCVILPGGFSYGDYLRAGAVAGKSPVVEALREFVANGGYVLGSCNGFQILCEAGLLPGVLMRNECLQYRCQSTNLLVVNETGTVLGLMPHPERAAETAMGGTDGLLLLQSLLGTLVEDGTFLKR